jgi:hypothetical protein
MAILELKDERVVRSLLDTMRPEFAYRIEVGLDHSGDRALWVIFSIPPKMAKSNAAAEKMRVLADRVQRTALDAKIRRWPYVRFEAA